MMGLAPDIFWNMTIIEWRAAQAGFAQMRGLRAAATVDAMRRSELLKLMQLYPDVIPNG
jgi:hypothetical protein